MKVAIMQPYFFPYIGYFQLVNAVDKFVFYDDVTFIKQGWINRNRILLNDKEHLITLKLDGASSYRLINEIAVSQKNDNLIKTIIQAYSKAPFFNEVIPLIQDVFTEMNYLNKISKIAEISVKKVSEYLNLCGVFETSSEVYSATKLLRKEERLIAICKENNADSYINPSGGKDLYNKNSFRKEGINLFFIKNQITGYKQFRNDFIPGLSIIDVMMFNSPDLVREMVCQYELE
jgi:WbqC-like protein family